MSAADPLYAFTLASLRVGGFDREGVEDWAENWVDRIGSGHTYDDLLDRFDGSPWEMPDGTWARVDLPEDTLDPVYVRLKNILRAVRAEL